MKWAVQSPVIVIGYEQWFNVLFVFFYYSFDALVAGVVAKETCDTVESTWFQLLHNVAVLPSRNGHLVEAPHGLDTDSRTYPFETIQEFCYDEA